MKTAAFVFALLTACTGMTGTFAGTGIESAITVSAAESTASITYKYYFEGTWNVRGNEYSGKTQCMYESDKPDDWHDISTFGWNAWDGDLYYEREVTGIAVSGEKFALKSGDNVILYSVKKNQYGNLEEKKLASLNADEEIAISVPESNELIYAKRYVRTGTASGVKTTIDNYKLVTSEGDWEYVGAFDWRNQYAEENAENFQSVQITKSEFDLKPYTYQAAGKADKLEIYSTALDANGEKTLVAELSGNDDYDLSVLLSKNKNTGYMAVRTQGGSSLDTYYGVTSLYRYNADAGKWSCFYAGGQHVSPTVLTLFPKEKTFPMLQGLDVQELRIYNGDNVKVIDKEAFYAGYAGVDFHLSEADSTKMGLCFGNDYDKCYWEADVVSGFDSDKISATQEMTISGKFFANVPYVTDTSYGKEESKEVEAVFPNAVSAVTAEGTPVVYLPEPAYDDAASEGNYRPVTVGATAYEILGDSKYEELEVGEHGNVYLLKGTKIIDSYTAQEFDSAAFTLPEFDKESDYFLKVAHADDSFNDYFTYYKWNEEAGKWIFRVNNEATPVASVPITHAEFTPYMDSDFTAELSLVSGNVVTSLSTWTKADFDEGKIKATLTLLNAGEYQLTFRTENGSYDTYQYVGIDPVSIDYDINPKDLKVYTFNTGYVIGCPAPYIDLPVLEVNPITNAEKGDEISIDGTAADGNPVHYELKQDWNNDSINLPEGDYTVTDNTAKYKADVSVTRNDDGLLQAQITDKSSVDDRYVNLTVPVETHEYTVSAPDGKKLEAGEMNGTVLAVSDLKMTADELKKESAYATFTAENGIINSVADGAFTEVTEEGFLAVTNDEIQKLTPENAEKGDVNLDGKVNVTDLVMLQKYLLNKQAYQAENFINADMNQDGKVNVFDLAFLKRKLLNK